MSAAEINPATGAEREVVGALLANAVEAWALIESAKLAPEHFHDERTTIFCVAADCIRRDGAAAVSLLSVADELRRIQRADLADNLHEYIDDSPMMHRIPGAIQDIKQTWAQGQTRAMFTDAVAEILAARPGEVADILERIHADTGKLSEALRPRAWMDTGIDAAALMQQEFTEPEFIISGFLPIGLTLLAAKRKLGKSWLALNLALAVAPGGVALSRFKCNQADVLYLALEDNHRRLQNRMRQILGDEPAPAGLHLFNDWPRIGAGFTERVEAWMKKHPNTKLLIVDVLAKVRPGRQRGGNSYDEDYEAMTPMHALAHKHGLAVVVIHHTRKQEADDVFDTISGTGGLTGAADCIMVLTRDNKVSTDSNLHITGRDVEEQELAMTFDGERGIWATVGDAEDRRRSEARQQIVDLLRQAGRGMRPAEVAKAIGRNEWTVRALLRRMVDDRDISKNKDSYHV